MPDTRQKPYDQEVEDLPRKALAVAAQRDIDILPEPSTERDVPAAPELGDTLTDIGVVEVFEELEAEHITKTARHIRITGKVEVDLEGIGEDARPRAQPAVLLTGDDDRLAHGAHLVGDQHLFGETHTEDAHALGEVVERLTAVIQLIGDVLIADDRAGDQLREQRYIGAEGDDVLLHRRFSAIDIDGVGHRLEGIEADTDRQVGQLRDRDVREREHIDGLEDHAGILEEAEHTQVDDHRRHQKRLRFLRRFLAVFIDKEAAGVVDDGRDHHQDDIHRLAPSVKDEIHNKKKEVAPLARTDIVRQ